MATIPEALAIAYQHHQAGRLPTAEQIYRQILQADPNHAEATHLLGLLAQQVGRFDIAIEYLKRAIALNGRASDYHNNLGNIYRAVHRLPEAAACYRRALELRPDFPEAHNNLGNVFKDQESPIEAIACYQRALALKPDYAESHNNLGLALAAQGNLDEAVASHRRAVELKPDLADLHRSLAQALTSLGELDAAIASYRRALELNPDFPAAHNNLGLALAAQGNLDEAVACYRRSLELRPEAAEVLSNLGLALKEQHKLDDAITCYRQALRLKPELAELHTNLGNAIMEQGQLDDAIACYRRALELKPDSAQAHNSLGFAFRRQGRVEEAVASFRRALALEPDSAATHYNLGLLLLQLGRYEEGWRECERRLEWLKPPRTFSKPRWNGERAEGRTVLIHGEQGLGDAIHFARYAPLIRDRSGARQVILEVPPTLARLFAHSVARNAEIVSGQNLDESALPPFDLQIPLMSLPLALQLFDPLPTPVPYLYADPEIRQAWRERLGSASAKRIGLVWRGNPDHAEDRRRSMPADALRPLLGLPGFQFYSLQIAPHRDEAHVLFQAGLIDLTAHITDFADTAALAAELDLIVTVDTAVAHLAGAMGRPVWTMLSHPCDWRWGVSGEFTPWYPTMRLLRQTAIGEWDAVVKRAATELVL